MFKSILKLKTLFNYFDTLSNIIKEYNKKFKKVIFQNYI